MVKINSTSSAQKTTLRKLTKAGEQSSSFVSTLTQGVSIDELAHVSAPSATNSLFVLQEIDERVVAKKHGDKILQLLDGLRISLLSGDMPDYQLKSLQQYLTKYQTRLTDPKLSEILAQIEQRAHIELAKRGLI